MFRYFIITDLLKIDVIKINFIFSLFDEKPLLKAN